MRMKEIRTRFAPSPTGEPHLGNLRTALFSWGFSRANQGKFFLRIEDTDKTREKTGAVDSIVESLDWVGLDSSSYRDELGRFRQRLSLFNAICPLPLSAYAPCSA